MEAVAKRANVAKGTPYRYFPTKEALFEGVVRQEIVCAYLDLNPSNLGAEETVVAFLRRTLLPAVRDTERKGRATIARLVLAEGARFPALVKIYRREMIVPLLKQIGSLAETARDRGELSSDSLVEYPHLLIAPIWFGIIHNGLIDVAHPLHIGDLFEAHLDAIFGGTRRGQAEGALRASDPF